MYTKEECLNKGKELGLKNIEQWPKCIDRRFQDLYEGLDCSKFIELVESQVLLNYSKKELKEVLDKQNHSGASYINGIYILSSFNGYF